MTKWNQVYEWKKREEKKMKKNRGQKCVKKSYQWTLFDMTALKKKRKKWPKCDENDKEGFINCVLAGEFKKQKMGKPEDIKETGQQRKRCVNRTACHNQQTDILNFWVKQAGKWPMKGPFRWVLPFC